MKLTNNELKVLTAIDHSEFGDQLRDSVWTFSVTDNSDLNPRSVPGIIASLLRKGLVITGGTGRHDDEYHIAITEAGATAYLAVVGKSKKNHPEPKAKLVMKFTFNTGRQYQPKGHQFAGQVIEVEVTDHPNKPGTLLVKFWDHSRGLDYGFITQAWSRSQREIQDLLMYQYDHNLCVSHWELDRRVTNGEI